MSTSSEGAQTPSSLGEFLRAARESRGITIEQVASASKINVRVLHALERDQYDDLPAKPFVRGFVSSYCRFVQLDPRDVLARFDAFMDQKIQARPKRESHPEGYAFERQEGERGKTILWTIMTSFIVVGGILLLVLKPSLKHKKHSALERLKAPTETSPSEGAASEGAPSAATSPSASAASQASNAASNSGPTPNTQVSATTITSAPIPTTTTAIAALAPAPAAAPGPSGGSSTPTPTSSPATPAAPDPADPLSSGVGLKAAEIKYKVIFKALADVWVRYQCDDRAVMKFLLRKDRALVLRGVQNIRFQASNARALTYNYNGRGTKPLSAFPKLKDTQRAASVVFPLEKTEALGEIFADLGKLPVTADPVLGAASENNPTQP